MSDLPALDLRIGEIDNNAIYFNLEKNEEGQLNLIATRNGKEELLLTVLENGEFYFYCDRDEKLGLPLDEWGKIKMSDEM